MGVRSPDLMAYVMVFAVALVTGALVFWLTLRAGGANLAEANEGDGFLPEALAGPAGAPGSGTYVPLGTDRRSWQTRTVGVLGLLIAITLAAALLALTLYQAGSAIAQMIHDFAS
jgi:hypothetical protein